VFMPIAMGLAHEEMLAFHQSRRFAALAAALARLAVGLWAGNRRAARSERHHIAAAGERRGGRSGNL